MRQKQIIFNERSDLIEEKMELYSRNTDLRLELDRLKTEMKDLVHEKLKAHKEIKTLKSENEEYRKRLGI